MSETQKEQVSLDSAVRAMLAPVEAQLARLEGQLNGGRGESAAKTTPVIGGDLTERLMARIDECHDALLEKISALLAHNTAAAFPPQVAEPDADTDDVETFPDEPQPVAQPVQRAEPFAGQPSAGTRQLAFALLGPLADEPAMDVDELLADLSRGDPSAQAFVGQLLLARSSDSLQLAPLLKDLGEAYYRWRPRTGGGFQPAETALAQWLVNHMADVGLSNRIELVRIGDRFDQNRHRAETRGVEIVGVHGWIVLRENGKVYTKALVTLG